jgi:hypothetical protein
LQGQNTKFGEQFLLANAQSECETGQVFWLTDAGSPFDNWLFRLR